LTHRMSLADVEPCEALYLSPHVETSACSCAGGMLAHLSRGKRVLVVTLFGAEEGGAQAETGPTARLGADRLDLGLPEARLRSAAHSRGESALFDCRPEDEEVLAHVNDRLVELRRRAQPRHVYAPLGVFGHIDHRLAHEASRAAFEPCAERDVFFYEERPWGFRRGAVRVRLAQLGARLPPAVTTSQDGGGLLSLVVGKLVDPFARRHTQGVWDAVRCAVRVFRLWKETRAWRPHRAFGLRVQPVLQEMPEAALRILGEACEDLPGGSPFGSRKRLGQLAGRHARRLGCASPVERYWLRLPTPEEA
jgi:LmbE family N-acetylglucosaminyl deacetylase